MTTYTSAMVNSWYNAVQFQNGVTATVNQYVTLLNNGSLTPQAVFNNIIQNPYTLDTVNPVLRLYQASFNSIPDQSGQQFWTNQYATGAYTFQSMANFFANSAQFTAAYGTTGASDQASSAVVTAMYYNILLRAPDAAGLAFWSQPGFTVGFVLAQFASSVEYVNNSSLPFANFQDAQINALPVSSGGTGTPLPTPPYSVYNFPGFPTTDYTLTTGVDAPGVGAFASSTGGVSVGSNSAVFGSFNGTVATFNSGDVVTAASGAINNTLSLSDLAGAATFNLNSINATVSNIPTVSVSSSVGITFDSTLGNYGGLTQFTLTGSGQQNITTAATTNTTVTNQTVTAAQGISAQGGRNVSATQTASDNGAAVWESETATLMPLPRAFDGFVEYSKRVSPTCLVNVERNRYSVPASFANRHGFLSHLRSLMATMS